MNYVDLTASAAEIRSKTGELFDIESYKDSDLVQLKRVDALADLKLDLIIELGLLETDVASLNEVTANHSLVLSKSLCLKQLEIYFLAENQGEGSVSYDRWKTFSKEYNNLKSTFASLRNSNVSSFSTVSFTR